MAAMRIAIPIDSGRVALHFGRAAQFEIVEIKDNKITKRETIDNPGHKTGYLPKFLKEKGVNMVICGGAGIRANEIFQNLGIELVLGFEEDIETVLEKIRKGEIKSSSNLCSPRSGKGMGIEKED